MAITFASQFPVNAFAQQSDGPAVKLGDSSLIPTVRLDYVSVDNAFYTAEDLIEATGVLLSPSVTWGADRRLLTVSASYSGKYGIYSESKLDFNDHNVSIRVDASPSSKHRTFGELSINKDHDELGTGQTTFTSRDGEQLVTTTVRLTAGYTFGTSSAKGNVGGGLIVGSQTFNDLGSITDGDDRSEITPYAVFSYRISPDTRLVAQTNFRVLDYDEDLRDRNEIVFTAGLDIAATERSGGSFRVGASVADYADESLDDSNEIVSYVSFYFKPRSYSRFDLLFNRRFETVDGDTDGPGASLVNVGSLSWNHDWTSRFSTLTKLGLQQTLQNCPSSHIFSNSAGFEFNVKVRRWLSFGAGVSSVNRSADACDPTIDDDDFDAERTTFGVHIVGTL